VLQTVTHMNLRIMLMLSASIIGLLLGGCQKRLVASDVQGAWIANKASRQKWIKGTNSCQIVLQADGTFTASVPDYMMVTLDKASGKLMSGRGLWSLGRRKALAPIGINLTFSEVNGERKSWSISDTLQAERGKQAVELFFYVGEEGGERFVFERGPGQPTAQSAER
jgi:hypothetical protein